MAIEFTDYVKNRIKKRKINKEEVINTIRNPDEDYEFDGKYYVQKDLGRGKIEIIYQKDNI